MKYRDDLTSVIWGLANRGSWNIMKQLKEKGRFLCFEMKGFHNTLLIIKVSAMYMFF